MSYINIRKEMDFSDFERECYSGAEFTLARIAEESKEDRFIEWLKDMHEGVTIDDAPTLTAINDLLRFDGDWVLKQLGIDKIKKYDIDDLGAESYYSALENYVNEFAPYDEDMDKLKNWLWENCGCSATNWTTGAIKTIKNAIAENSIIFDADGNIIND